MEIPKTQTRERERETERERGETERAKANYSLIGIHLTFLQCPESIEY